ncbi:hypothetical protein LR48_Vigan07g026100 [Vigna angularis]|uniref:Uncharacterized protein n=1 Tax=Phaseolus angularis TaxID=3914 RepID=A0A0L9UVG1_PHAAN|nr:hypothetical protein LR48_Vigan07g026100 [Vigna angularis]
MEPEEKEDSTREGSEPVGEDQVLDGSLQENSADRAFVQIDEPNWTFVQVDRPLFVEHLLASSGWFSLRHCWRTSKPDRTVYKRKNTERASSSSLPPSAHIHTDDHCNDKDECTKPDTTGNAG